MYLFFTSLSQLTNSVHDFTLPPSFFPLLPSPSFFLSIGAFIQAGYSKCILFADFCIYRHQWGSHMIVHVPSLLMELRKGLFLNLCFHSPLSFHPLLANLLSSLHIVTKLVFWKNFPLSTLPFYKKTTPTLNWFLFSTESGSGLGWGWGEALLSSSSSNVFSVDILLPSAWTLHPRSTDVFSTFCTSHGISQCYALVILSLKTNTLLTIYQYKSILIFKELIQNTDQS